MLGLPTFPIRELADIGQRYRVIRAVQRLNVSEVAARQKLSRNTIHRLEAGGDVTVSTLLLALRACGYTIELTPMAAPSLDEMRARFPEEQD